MTDREARVKLALGAVGLFLAAYLDLANMLAALGAFWCTIMFVVTLFPDEAT